MVGVLAGIMGCASEDRPADFLVSAGVESVTVFDGDPGAPLTLYDAAGTALVTIITDELGITHFSYIPDTHVVMDPSDLAGLSLANGITLPPGDNYIIQDDTTFPPKWSGPFTVLAIDDVPEDSHYEKQVISGLHYSVLTEPEGDPELGYHYLEMRDGVLLGAMVRLPDPLLYGEGPYPTVIEYSGYAPSRPDRVDSTFAITGALGYAMVSVNMRGTGCSGGVYDVFNRAQHADGYDIAEIVARQDWVLNNQVGMVGLSYPGISQLYVASTNPPSLAGIVPLSTIADAWEMQWPGGIYNMGFTQQWIEKRDEQTQPGGTSWVSKRIEEGDLVCEENLKLSPHSMEFESFLQQLEMRPLQADDRDLNLLVQQIEAPVFYGGAFQDEQTGAQFGGMLDRFYQTESLKVIIANGRHPDGFSPFSLHRWFEFLEFYVAERIPVLNPVIRTLGGQAFGDLFGMDNVELEEDRFSEFGSYEEALSAYEAEPSVQVLFESGGDAEQPGAPMAGFLAEYDSWPTPEAEPIQWFLGPEGMLTDTLSSDTGADLWQHDEDAGAMTFFGPAGYEMMELLWDLNWTRFDEGDMATYMTAPFAESRIIAGPGIAELWVRSPVEDVMVQVTLTEIRSDGTEMFIQSGWLRLGHREATEGEDLRLQRTFSEFDFMPMPLDEWVSVQVAIPSVAHPVRAGSSLRMVVSSPGRDHGTWEFMAPEYEETPTFELGYGEARPSSLTMAVLPGIEIPEELPPCPSLRGQPCREYVHTSNIPLE